MSWWSRYVVYRVSGDSKGLQEVFATNDFKQAKYWIRYIAEVGDALFSTPTHHKHPGGDLPEYSCHKVQSGVTETDKDTWMETCEGREIPKEQQTEQG